MTSNFRLFAGLTSFMSNLCMSHFCASGPEGILESRAILLARLLSVTAKNGNGDRNVAEENQPGDDARCFVQERAVHLVLPANGLEHGAHTVAQVQTKQCDRNNIKDGYPDIAESNHHHPENI